MPETTKALVGMVAGSDAHRELLRHTQEMLERFGVSFSVQVASEAQAPQVVRELEQGGCQVIVATSDGALNLPAVLARHTTRPVLGVPAETNPARAKDALDSAMRLPAGVAVGALAVGKAGASNAALLAVAILANTRPELREKLQQFRKEQEQKVLAEKL